jgi:hypothetical protein
MRPLLLAFSRLGVYGGPDCGRYSEHITLVDQYPHGVSNTRNYFDAVMSRVKAITQNTSIRINFDTTVNIYQIQQRNLADLTTWNNVDKAQKLPAGIQFGSVTGNPVTFQSGRGSTLPGSNSTIISQNI